MLLAEIAGHRGKLDISVENYLDLAKLTRDYKIVERAARIAVYARDDVAASEAAKLWLEIDPYSADAHQIMAVMSIRSGDIESAIASLEHILGNSNGKMDQKLWMIANMLGGEKDQTAVIQVMERLMQSRQDDADALFAYAHVIGRMGNTKKALEILEKVVTLAPENNNAVLSYVSLLQKENQVDKAIDWLQKHMGKKKEDFNLHLVYARLLADSKRFDDSLREFESLIAKAPNNVDVLYALGLLYLQNNRLDDSARYFARLAEQDVRIDESNYYLGRIAEEQGKLDKAGSYYQGVRKGEHYFDSQLRLGFVLARRDKYEQALEHLETVKVNNDQQKSLIIQAESELYQEQKKYAEALDVYNTALNDPSITNPAFKEELMYSRAMLAEKMGRLDILEADLVAIIENNPNHSQALNALGYTLADRTQRYDEAYQYIQRAMQLNPNDFYIMDSMGWVLYRMGRLDEAVDYLQKAMSLRNDPEIAAHLGEVLWVKGDRKAAEKIWDTALEQTPDDTRLLNVIERFKNQNI